MLAAFFSLAAVSPGRRRALQALVLFHILLVALALTGLNWSPGNHGPVLFGSLLLILGIVEGALLVGWRLTQIPKSQALEFLLVSQCRPQSVFRGEALVGLARLTLTTLAGLPLLVVMIVQGLLLPEDLPALLGLPVVWGAVTGLGLAAWAYEPAGVRRWGERVLIGLVILYLVVGILAAEHLPLWLAALPPQVAALLLDAVRSFHDDNPFGVMRRAMDWPPGMARAGVHFGLGSGLVLAGLFFWRAMSRFQGHFQDEHYRPIAPDRHDRRLPVGDRPLTWWAVRRVSRYAGRINLWLAGGFGLLYAAYTVAGDAWPAWLGRQVFLVFERMGGIPTLAAALVLLAAVPAAFQYGVWDGNAPDRSRRLELLLLTQLDGDAYWQAAQSAAWRRGRGYLLVAGLLWTAALLAGQATFPQVLASLAAGIILWGLYFALGFQAFARGVQAGSLGLLLTVGLPVGTILAFRAGWSDLGGWLPPGSVWLPLRSAPSLLWLLGPLLAATAALLLAGVARRTCDAALRRWYDLHHGVRAGD